MNESKKNQISQNQKDKLIFNKNEITVSHNDLFNTHLNIEGRDIVIGFNEPSFKKSHTNLDIADLDSKLNARLPSYFLPAIQIATAQEKRPRLIIISGIFAALKWNAQNDNERKLMLINNNLKVDFLKSFFEKFFPETFSLVEFRNSYDFLKISEHKLELLWNIFEKTYPQELGEVKKKLLQYKEPKSFANGVPDEKELKYLFEINKEKLQSAFKYALAHLFACGDINIGSDFSHNPKGYCSIGEHNEAVFNVVRSIGYKILKEVGEIIFDQEIMAFENMKVVIDEAGANVPPAYNGAFRKSRDEQWLDEVTYENEQSLSYYDGRPRLAPAMEYLYKLVPKDEYEAFWNSYQKRYFDLKRRYFEAYKVEINSDSSASN